MKRVKGKLIKWDNDKAFGFIVPNHGGSHIFIHKTAFANRTRTPFVNDVITFSKTKDKQGRVCADNATFTGEKLKKKQAKKANMFSIYLAFVFISFIVFSYFTGRVPVSLALAYFALSVITFLAYAIDKSKAQSGSWRTQESTLHLFALIGGWPGAAIAQQLLRHKSKKAEFRIAFWLTVVANLGVLYWLLFANGKHWLTVFM